GARAVVNLAYARDASPFEVYPATRRLMHLVDRTREATGASRLIHISTLAVFGYRFERPPWPLAVKWRPADPYIESKIYAERLLLRAAARGSDDLAIVRLGNVIGPAAPIWIASLAQRILEARPVGYTSGLGYANATSIDNVGSYICELVRCPSSDLADMG